MIKSKAILTALLLGFFLGFSSCNLAEKPTTTGSGTTPNYLHKNFFENARLVSSEPAGAPNETTVSSTNGAVGGESTVTAKGCLYVMNGDNVRNMLNQAPGSYPPPGGGSEAEFDVTAEGKIVTQDVNTPEEGDVYVLVITADNDGYACAVTDPDIVVVPKGKKGNSAFCDFQDLANDPGTCTFEPLETEA